MSSVCVLTYHDALSRGTELLNDHRRQWFALGLRTKYRYNVYSYIRDSRIRITPRMTPDEQ